MRKTLCVVFLMTLLLGVFSLYLLVPARSKAEMIRLEAKGSVYMRGENHRVIAHIIVPCSLEARGYIYLTAEDVGRNITIIVP